MSAIQLSIIGFSVVFGGAVCGMFLFCKLVPEAHLAGSTRDMIKHVMGLIGTLTVLVLGLSIATAKGMYDRHDLAIKDVAVKVLMLDHLLGRYGPETSQIREMLKQTLRLRRDVIWSENKNNLTSFSQPHANELDASIERALLELKPASGLQKFVLVRILSSADEVQQIRWMVLGNVSSSVPKPFFVIIVIWLCCLFTSFGLIVPRNTTMLTILFFCSIVVASSLFLIAELDDPYNGWIRLPSKSFDFALSQISK